MKKYLAIALVAALSAAAVVLMLNPLHSKADQTTNNFSRSAAGYYASQYAWRGLVVTGNTATGSATVVLGPSQVSASDGRQFQPFGPGNNLLTPTAFDMGANNETVTPTAVSAIACPATGQFSFAATCIAFTGSFTNTHGVNTVVASGSFGLQEAINDAFFSGGGKVVIDNTWFGTNATINAAIPFGNVVIEDTRAGGLQYWNAVPSTTTTIAAPATLTATTVGFGLNGANTTGGTYTGASTYFVAVACVDLLGNESQPSATFSAMTAGTGTTNQIGFAAPAAQTGCVGWVPYISLAGGTYALAYRVPLATYANGVPTANGVCTLTKVETVTAACAIANTTYGQVGSNAIVSALTVNTARIWVGLGGTSTTADVVGNSNARTTYGYVAGAHVGVPGLLATQQAFAAATGPLTAAPAVLGTIHLLPGYMNFVGKTIQICGNATSQGGSTATIDQIQFYWDADGSNTTGAGVILPGPKVTATLSATPAVSFCQNLTTTVAGAGATAGSIQSTQGWIGEVASVAATTAATYNPTIIAATVPLLNLAQEARIDVVLLHTTGTDGTWTLNDLHVTSVN